MKSFVARKAEAYVDRSLTSTLVIAEGHSWFLRRYDQRRAIQLLNFILRSIAYLADAHGLVIMTAHRIKSCWSTDRHLGLTGASLVN